MTLESVWEEKDEIYLRSRIFGKWDSDSDF